MDRFCINRGTLLDDPSTVTLESPENHSFHCLLDVGACYESGFNVLGDKDPETGLHTLGYRLDDTDAVMAAGQATGQQGYCSSCTGDSSSPDFGYQATVKGTVSELGDGSDGVSGTPMLTNIEMLSSDVVCESAINPVTTEAPETTVAVSSMSTEPSTSISTGEGLKVGDEVCITSYVVSNNSWLSLLDFDEMTMNTTLILPA